ncbi:MAG TPA: hypothetical protein VMV14_00470 [Acidimicrobiales bacterium]|nr:hypothetical protein [Acidimicrobiales bacterium]
MSRRIVVAVAGPLVLLATSAIAVAQVVAPSSVRAVAGAIPGVPPIPPVPGLSTGSGSTGSSQTGSSQTGSATAVLVNGGGGPVFEAGAAVGDFTPPPFGTPIDGKPDPADCIAGTPLEAKFNGPRKFDFEEPYIDQNHLGHYTEGDPYVDCNHDGRWDGNYIGGGTNNPRYYSYVLDPVTARALAVKNTEGHTVVVEVLDQEGLFNVFQAQIRDQATALLAAQGKTVDNMFLSATHDEEAPDSLGLGGDTSVTSGVDQYWAAYMVEKSAEAIVAAVDNMTSAHLRFAEPLEPANLRQCWSSYPYVDDQLMPTLQAVSTGGQVIATLTSVSQHAETLGFNGIAPESASLSADWPFWFRSHLEQTYGGVGIEMAGSVGSVETPQVFSALVNRVPEAHQGASHPAGCNTLFNAPAGNPTPEALGYQNETKDLGIDLADAVIGSLGTTSTWSTTDTVWGERATICVPVKNVLFAAAGAAGVFADRSASVGGCRATLPAAPNGSTAGTEAQSEVAAYRIGDGEFMSVPGEVFPFTFLGSFLGPEDLQYPQYDMTPMLMAYMHAPYRFVDGLAEDMLGYIFPQGNAVGIPGQHPLDNEFGTTDQDRFGCGHSDDSESAGAKTGDIVGQALVQLLEQNGAAAGSTTAPEEIELGRYALPDGHGGYTLSRDPLGNPESLQCNANSTFVPNAAGPATAVWVAAPNGAAGQGQVIVPAAWLSLSGRPQATPDRNTRGWIDAAGTHHWLDVFPDLTTPPPLTLQQRVDKVPPLLTKVEQDLLNLPGAARSQA